MSRDVVAVCRSYQGIIQKRCSAKQEKADAGDELQSIAVDECNFIAAEVARIGPGNFLQQACRGRAGRPPPADAVQSVMIIGSAI
jgi:hypothetical protein